MYVTFVSFQENEKGDCTITFRFYGDPDGGQAGMQYLDEFFSGICTSTFDGGRTGAIKPNQWSEIAEQRKTKSLRQVAKEYGVSHEAVRRAFKAVFHY